MSWCPDGWKGLPADDGYVELELAPELVPGVEARGSVQIHEVTRTLRVKRSSFVRAVQEALAKEVPSR